MGVSTPTLSYNSPPMVRISYSSYWYWVLVLGIGTGIVTYLVRMARNWFVSLLVS